MLPSPPSASSGTLPLISIVTITFNSVTTLEATLQSAIQQNYPHAEHLVIDGGSTDGTLEIIQRYQDYLTYWVSEPDKGIYDAINKGIRAARGTLISVLNSGDTYAPGILEAVDRYFHQNSFQMAVGDYYWVYPDRQLRVSPQLSSLSQGYPVCHQATFYRRELHETIGEYDPQYALAADYHFIRQVYDRYGIFQMKEVVCHYDLEGVSGRAFMKYAQEVRNVSHQLKDSFWQVEWTYWSKYMKYGLRRCLHALHLEGLLHWYRLRKHKPPPIA